MEEKKERDNTKWIKPAIAAAAIIGAFIILPNTSMPIAHAMQQIPIIGPLVEVVTFRNYEYESERNMADIEVPEIKTDTTAQDSELQKKLDTTTEEINLEIQQITDKLVEEFESHLLSGCRQRLPMELLLHHRSEYRRAISTQRYLSGWSGLYYSYQRKYQGTNAGTDGS